MQSHSLSIVYEATHHCNLNCQYCYNIWNRPNQPSPASVPFSQAKKTINQIFKQSKITHFTFSGGEPLLAERLLELVLQVRMKNCPVNIISNGTGSQQEYKILKDLNTSLIEFPFHSPTETIHDLMTQTPGSFQQVIETIKYCQNINHKIAAVIVLTKQNIHAVGETIIKLLSLGIRNIMLARFNIGGRGILYIKNLLPTKSELNQAFQTADTIAANNSITLTANVCTPLCIVNPTKYPHIRFFNCNLDVSKRPITLSPNGDIRFCNHSPIIAGNIYKQPLGRILISDYAREWGSYKPAYCDNCHLWSRCLGGCRAASEQMGGTLWNEDPIIKVSQVTDI